MAFSFKDSAGPISVIEWVHTGKEMHAPITYLSRLVFIVKPERGVM